jgi:hypothetical protein
MTEPSPDQRQQAIDALADLFTGRGVPGEQAVKAATLLVDQRIAGTEELPDAGDDSQPG